MDLKKAAPPVLLETPLHHSPLRKGPWTVDEDTILVNYIATHGQGHWNSLARCAGLRRSGKSCRLRWLNYLRPDVRRGNITLQEQILILDLHSRWGNRWSKIAQHLPGRTDNEIKNYWRTRVIKQAKQLKCDVNSKHFRDTLRYVWMPRLLERVKPTSQPHTPNPLDPNPTGNGLNASEWVKANPINHSTASYSVDHQLPSNLDTMVLEQGSHGNVNGGDTLESLWNDQNMWFLQQLSDDLQIKYNSLP